ncbi:M10 family metallopeptidase C-terminal domain-containing protein [Azospirillum doebereinerae]|uniref:Matrixin family metalloprotease n=1 Tax=Azospirillum doebereinerae TaxID=92933 RepID=A0A3S0XJH4_9PROT|nr:M10 family metallopeptidase C-terminal domain-containing protein [Azospirillum doebereinerae]RUQ65225.1 matrixin family metalloprotease [Azospirillum doebereinerae]
MSDDEVATGSAASIAYYISDLLATGAPHWGAGNTVLGASSVGGAVTVTFAFMTSSQQASRTDSTGFAAMSATQKAAVRQALATWSAVANVTFVETADVANATVTFATNRQRGQSSAYAYYPSTAATGGAVFVANDATTNTTPTTGSYGFMTLVHEIGHALGLKHPGDYNAASSSGGEEPYLPTAEDNYAYSVMSYTNNASLPSGVYPTGPSLYDIAAIQYLYGANRGAAPGNDTYTISADAFVTLWDPNGINTLDGGAQTAALSVDLRAGTFSSVGGVTSIALAYGTRVQKAVGGSGNDVFIVNSLGNRIDGGAGDDTVVLSGSRSQYTIQATTTGSYIVSGVEGGDVLTGIQHLRFSDTTLALTGSVATSFDALRYVASNADLMTAFGANADAGTSHYLNLGVFEGRSLTGFDPYNYLAGYADLLAAFGSDATAATQHYIASGRREGRNASSFDALSYESSNPDLIAAFGTDTEAVERHYLTTGRFEGRSLTRFNAAAYLAANADLTAAFGSDATAAKRHYIQFGYAEGRAIA